MANRCCQKEGWLSKVIMWVIRVKCHSEDFRIEIRQDDDDAVYIEVWTPLTFFMAVPSVLFGLQGFLLHCCARSIHIGVVVAHLGFFHHCEDHLQISLIFVAVPSIVLPWHVRLLLTESSSVMSLECQPTIMTESLLLIPEILTETEDTDFNNAAG